MRKLTALFTLAAKILLFTFSATPVRGAENDIDWDNVQWEDFQWDTIDEGDNWNSLYTWMSSEADIDSLISIDIYCKHSAFSEEVSVAVAARFLSEPQAMLEAMAKLDKDTRQLLIGTILFGTIDMDQLVSTVESLRITGASADAAYGVLSELIDYAEENYGLVITNPKTGDYIEIAAALFVLAASGTLMTVFHKKEY